MAFIMTRVDVGDFDAWKPMFDQDPPGARKQASGYRLFRSVENPDEVFVQVEFDSPEEAKQGAERLIASGVLDRWPDHTGPTVVEEAEALAYR
jgi:hypothetical protein